MKIRSAELVEIHLKLKERFEISTGGWDLRRILLLRMESEDGEAWSECVAAEAPNYSYETPETAWHVLTDYVLPEILGKEVDPEAGVLAPVSWIRGHPMAMAAVEMGAWGLEAVGKGVSLKALVGGVAGSGTDPRPGRRPRGAPASPLLHRLPGTGLDHRAPE